MVRYLCSTVSQGIACHSSVSVTTLAYLHYPLTHDRETYTGATPPPPDQSLQGFCGAIWGSHIGNAVDDGADI